MNDVLMEVNPSYGFNPQDVYDIEKLIIETSKKYEPEIEAIDSYNKMTASKAFSQLNGFDWDLLTTEMGCHKPPPFFITYSTTYIKAMTELLIKNWNTEKWKSYWVLRS